MRVAQIPGPKQPFQIVEREVPEPGPGAVRVKVEACGICHSDMYTAEGLWPGIEYPRAPGHEVAGVVHALGPGAAGWTVGDRVGLGWHGGHCGYCESCRRGAFVPRAAEGYARMMSGDARFRVVLTMGKS